MNPTKDENPYIPMLIGFTTFLLIAITVLLVNRLKTQQQTPEDNSVSQEELLCGATCGDLSGTCANGLSCVDGLCKNLKCVSDTDCTCPTEQTTGAKCNYLCGGTYGACNEALICVDSQGNQAVGVGRCRTPKCPSQLSCVCK